jgi:hypothetical protein
VFTLVALHPHTPRIAIQDSERTSKDNARRRAAKESTGQHTDTTNTQRLSSRVRQELPNEEGLFRNAVVG